MRLTVAVVTLWAEDFEKTVQFYKDVLGFSIYDESDNVVHFDINGIYFTIIRGTPCKVTNSIIPRFPVIAFSVENLENVVQVLIDNSIDLPWGIEKSHAAKWVMFNDPAGNLIELVEFQ
ncbi:MAG TPA: VOC family protein [Methanocella sp.]|nr:VOC family protein [Methanocella sp.]